MTDRQITFTVLRGPSNDYCSEGPTCPKQIVVDQDPDHTYFVFKTDIDPDIAATLASHVAASGEALGKVPNNIAGR